MEEGAHALHDDEDGQREDGPEAEDDVDGDGADVGLAEATGEGDAEDELPQHFRQLQDDESHVCEGYFGRKKSQILHNQVISITFPYEQIIPRDSSYR